MRFALAWSESLVSVTSVAGLVIFFSVFVGILIWLATRSRKQVDRWSRLPLKDNDEASSENS